MPPPLRADGYIPTKATLVLAPSHLLKQWPREIEKFSGGALKTATISTMADLNKLTIKDLQRVDVVVLDARQARRFGPGGFRLAGFWDHDWSFAHQASYAEECRRVVEGCAA